MAKLNIGIKTVRVLRLTHPALIEEIESMLRPELEDLNLIKDIHRYVFYSDLSLDVNYQEIVFVAIVLTLYSPESIIMDCKAKSGSREVISASLSKSGPHVSYLTSQARAYMKINTFKEKVSSLIEAYLSDTTAA